MRNLGERARGRVRRVNLPKQLSLLQTTAALGDLLTVTLIYASIGGGFGLYGSDHPRLVTWCTVLGIVWIAFAVRHGAYDRSLLRERVRSSYVAGKVTIVAGAVFHLIPLVGGPIDSRITSATIVLALTVAVVAWRFVFSCLAPAALPEEPVDLLVVGTGPGARALAAALATRHSCGLRIAAFVEPEPSPSQPAPGVAPVAPLSGLSELVRRSRRRPRIVLGVGEESHAQVYDVVTALAQNGIEVVSVAGVYEEITGCVPVWHLGNTWWAVLPRPSTDVLYAFVKRAIDIAGAIVGLVVLGALLVIGPLLRRETGGSILFHQARIGKDGRLFDLLKLRTLPERPAPGDHWQRKRANSAAAIGTFLRSTGLDELPQCWNVLRGEMSLIGPRPYVPDEVEDFQARIPFFRSRAQVRPGITGWAQVNWGYGHSIDDEVEKLQYDLFYVGHQSTYLDLLVVLRTCHLIARRRRLVESTNTEPVVVGGI